MLQQQLTNYKRQLDQTIDAYSKQLLVECEQQFTSYSRDVVAAFCTILRRGGKRLRGALVMNAYDMTGGTDQALSLKAAQAIEMVHAYLLIIDDISDRSLLRRGGPTAHIMLAEQHRQMRLRGSSDHFGIAQAINAALFGSHLAQLELTKLPVSDSVKLEAVHDLNRILITTLHGQMNDIFNEAVQDVGETMVGQTLTWKTAYYTFQNPLQLGATLAGADLASASVLEEYSKHLGLAFQIADDILGTFGSSFESGKSAQDDIKEGKVTLLVSRALERASPQQKQELLSALGNQRLTPLEQEACRRIIEDTGALDYARQLAKQHAAKAVAALDSAPRTWSKTGVAFLRELAAFVVQRKA